MEPQCDAPARTAAGPPAPLSSFASGRYVVRRLLGEGGQKTVFLAHDVQLDRDVAIALLKVEGLDPQGVARVQREAQAMARLGAQAHIVTIFDIGEHEGRPFIVCEFMGGGDLHQALRAAGGALPAERALQVGRDVCRALAVAHNRGILHRDIKPANVWLTEEGTAKLGDFGLAVSLEQSRVTQAGMVLGTAAYMAPEQALGGEVDQRSDLYSFGCVLYEMVTGRPPFLGDDAIAVVSQHINTAPVSPSWHQRNVPQALERLTLRLLAKAPEERPKSAAEVLSALEAISTAPEAEGPRVEANPLDRLAGGVFVGREQELGELRSSLDEALSGRGRMVLLAGEPGIGKTRLSEELATYAQVRGAQVLWGRCYEGEGAPAYWPWVQAIRSYVYERPSETLLSELGTGAADIAQIISEVRERFPGLPQPPNLEPEQARFRLFDSITTFLKNASRAQPLVLVLDDLHWADKPSLLLLQFLARELRDARFFVLGCYRDVEFGRQHPLSHTLAELAREELSQRVVIRGLAEHDVARFIEMTAGIEPPAGLVTTIYRETEGNPFFVKEVVSLLASERRLEQDASAASWTVEIPESVREVVGRRLDQLSEACNRVLTIASVIGREFGLNVLERASGIEGDPLLEALDEAAAARVITEVPRAIGSYRFSHGLIRETLYEELTTTRRVRLHRQIGDALEALYGSRAEAHLAELAYHFCEAAPRGGDVDKAVQYAARAGERAMRQLAYEQAAAHYESGLHAMEHGERADESRRAELLIGLGDAHWRTGERDAARDALRRATEVAKSAGSPEQSIRALLRLEETTALSGLGEDEEWLVTLIEEALDTLGTEDSALRATVLAHYARSRQWADDRDRTHALARQAVDMARRVGDERVLLDALVIAHDVCARPDELADRLAMSAELARIAANVDDPETLLLVCSRRIVNFVQAGNLPAADQEFEAGVPLARKISQPLFLWLEAMYRVMRATLEGRFDQAEQVAQQALAAGQRVQGQGAVQAFAAQLFVVRWAQGRLSELQGLFKGFADQNPGSSVFGAALAYMYAQLDEGDRSSKEFASFRADSFVGLPLDGQWLMSISLLAEVSAYLDDRPSAEVLYGLLEPYAGRNIVAAYVAICVGSASRLLGLLAATLQDWGRAEAHFEAALAENAKLSARPFVAHTQYDYANMLLSRDQSGDREKAHEFLAQALDTAKELGMKALTDRANTLNLRL